MKKATLFLLCLGGLALSSCCCQSQSAPKLRPLPKDTAQPVMVIDEPVLIAPSKK